MKYGARNNVVGKIEEIKKGSLMSQVKVSVDGPIDITAVMTLDTLADLGVKKGDSVRVLVKAVNVILVREWTRVAMCRRLARLSAARLTPKDSLPALDHQIPQYHQRGQFLTSPAPQRSLVQSQELPMFHAGCRWVSSWSHRMEAIPRCSSMLNGRGARWIDGNN